MRTPMTIASAVAASVITSGTILILRLETFAAGAAASVVSTCSASRNSCFGSASDMAISARDEENHQRKHDNIDVEYEKCRMPHVVEQTKSRRCMAQADCDQPRSDHQHRD